MRRGGFPYAVVGGDWLALSLRYLDAPAGVSPIREVVASIVESGVSDQLMFTTSMWDLIVTPAPAGPPPIDVVVVRGAMGLKQVPEGRIVVEHLPLVGIADSIEREATDGVPLFWRFMLKKYGVAPRP